MKKIIIAVVLFLIGFVASYIFLCFYYETEMVWALEISTRQKVLAYIKYKALIKTIISLFVGVFIDAIPYMIGFKKLLDSN